MRGKSSPRLFSVGASGNYFDYDYPELEPGVHAAARQEKL